MNQKPFRFIVVSTPIGFLGSGKGGGVEVTLISILKGLLELGYEVSLVAPEGSLLPLECKEVQLFSLRGLDQPSWQHIDFNSPITIPLDGVLPRLLEVAFNLARDTDVILNLSFDWLPLWLTPHVQKKVFHLISMGAVSKVMKDLINNLSKTHHSRLAFHTFSQASDFDLSSDPVVVGNGFDLKNYTFQETNNGALGWAGRVAPEKGLEDAANVAALLRTTLIVWGLIEDNEYASQVEASVPAGTIQWRGFLETEKFQKQLGSCRAFINTPKWNEAYGNVVMEAMACGVPVVAYDRGGPGELVKSGVTGWLVPPDDLDQLKIALSKIDQIDRQNCRSWAIQSASYQAFSKRLENWIIEGLDI